jgi:hypothetical protein
MKKQSKTAQIRVLLEKGLTVAQIAKKLGTSPSSVYQVRWKMAKEKAGLDKLAPDEILEAMSNPETVGKFRDAIWAIPVQEPVQNDLVNHPPHYKAGGIETIDFIEAKQLGYHLGNVVKYISRAQLKGGMEDLLKAQWYLNRAIEKGEVNE